MSLLNQYLQAPKGPSKGEKLSLIFRYIRSSRTCHTLRELEKSLPSIASINSIVVKDLVKDLTDEGKLKVEKIGTGNWYWSFGDDDKKLKELEVAKLKEEVEKTRQRVEDLGRKRDETKKEKEDREVDEVYTQLAARAIHLEEEVANLRKERDELEMALSGGVGQIRSEIERYKEETEMWTNDIYILEGQFRDKIGIDPEAMQALQKGCYGTEYVDGEGLKEIETPR